MNKQKPLSRWLEAATSPHLKAGWTEDMWLVTTVYNSIRERHAAKHPWTPDYNGEAQRRYMASLNL